MYSLGRYAAVSLFWISAAGCTLIYSAAPPLDLSQAVLIFSDEFNGTSLDTTKWNATSYNYHGLNAYNPAMVSVTGGHLVLQLQHIPWLGQAYSGGQVDTDHLFTPTYGYFEARLQAARGSGLHSSWWLWPDDNVWPPELDIVEIRGMLPSDAYLSHHWFDPDVPLRDGGYSAYNKKVFHGPDFTQGFHVFGMEWSPTAIIWYIDGVERFRSTTHSPSNPFRLQLDLALDSFGGPVDETTILPAVMLVDYVRVYRLDGPPVASLPATTSPGN